MTTRKTTRKQPTLKVESPEIQQELTPKSTKEAIKKDNLESRSELNEAAKARIERYKESGVSYCEKCAFKLMRDPVNRVNICPINDENCDRNKTKLVE